MLNLINRIYRFKIEKIKNRINQAKPDPSKWLISTRASFAGSFFTPCSYAENWLISSDSDQHERITWNETLNEGKNPAPMWWFWLILATMIFSVIYLMLYPGLGSYSGALKMLTTSSHRRQL